MKQVLAALSLTLLTTNALAQSAAPTAVAKSDQFGTLVDACEKAKKCLGGDRNSCAQLDSHQCVSYIEGIFVPMRMACNARRTNKDFPKAMSVKEAKTSEKIDVLIKFAKANPGELVKHKGPVTVRAFAQELPCEH